MSFHEDRFPENLSYGSAGGPERRTEIVTLANGFEERSTPWADARRSYDAGLGLRSLDALEKVIAFFEARHGQLYGFRWKDWLDFKSCPPSQAISASDQLIGIGDGKESRFQLTKYYHSGGHLTKRKITKPIGDRVLVALDGTAKKAPADFTVDTQTGVISFSIAPGVGQKITAGFEFDVPVRFDTDRIHVSISAFQAGEVPNIPIIEVKL